MAISNGVHQNGTSNGTLGNGTTNGTATNGSSIEVLKARLKSSDSTISCDLTCKKCTNGNKVTVDFPDGSFTFHSQWLHDARCDDGAARNARTAICQQPTTTVRVDSVQMLGKGMEALLEVNWNDGISSKFPLPWLRVMASLAARPDSPEAAAKPAVTQGWTVESLKIPEISYKALFREDMSQKELDIVSLDVLDKILSSSAAGIVKIIDLPPPNMEDEHNHINNLNTIVLKKLFGSVFHHPIRGADKTFNVSSHNQDATRKVGLANYDTTQVLLPHTDHAFYDNPIQVQGFYGLEGESMNTWVSALAALETLKQESPEYYQLLCKAPMVVGRISRFYGDPLYQATVDTAVTMHPGYPDRVKRIRWHPNLTGSVLSPYDEYKDARLAHLKMQEIMRRDTHQLKMKLKPGDLYLWDNFRLLHGREMVLETPRTGVGQTVSEHIVHDRYRALSAGMLKGVMGEEWLCSLPMQQLRDMLSLVQNGF